MLINYGSCIVFLNNNKQHVLTVISDTPEAEIELRAAGYTQIDNHILVPTNTVVMCTLYKEEYVPHSQFVTVTEDQTIHMEITEPGLLFTINPTPADATVTIIIDGYSYNTNILYVPNGREFTYKVEKPGYLTEEKTITITEATTITVELQPDIPSTDYEYTVQTDNSAILTKYIGTNTDVIAPTKVEGEL